MEDTERALSKEKLLEAVDTLENLRVAFRDAQMLNDDQARQACLAAMTCAMAGLHVVELATHLQEGMEFYEAIRATARGELKIPTEMAEEWQKVTKDLHNPMRHN